MGTASAGSAQRLRQLVDGLAPEQRTLLATLLAESAQAQAQAHAAAASSIPSTPAAPAATVTSVEPAAPLSPDAGDMQFSLFFFSEDSRGERDKYRLLIESAILADELGFSAIWTPERHFDPFGGSYPNPSLLAAALAMVTRRVRLCAGSVVLPLHHPIRVAEEWAVVDNLSGGRVAMACASGWHLADFVFAPRDFDARKERTWQNLDIIQRLWRGETVAFPGAHDQDVSVATFPRPIQPTLPIWVTCTGSPETFRKAGQLGAHVLTHLTAQSVDDLAEHVATYHAALAEHGRDPAAHRVTVMIHTFVGESDPAVKETVRAPMYDYLRSNINLHVRQARERGTTIAVSQFTADDERTMLEHAFEKYYAHRGLFGTPATCRKMIDALARAGVTEVACLVDFGLDRERVLASVRALSTLFVRAAPEPAIARQA